ncbi:MAG: type II secretion system minor pseudopilin [Planctomycetota bacterium]|jgi:DNA uptake protein ComE-like DNA-binding protein
MTRLRQGFVGQVCPRRLRGVILIAALFILAMLSVLTVAFLQNEQVELRLGRRHWDRAVARQAAWSGLHRAMADLAASEDPSDHHGRAWYGRDASSYEEVEVGEDAFFSLLRNDPDRPDDIAYGLDDENGKININTAPAEILAELPGLNSEIANAIVDWRDDNDEISNEEGAEESYYLSLRSPYSPRNAPFETIEELLLVRGITPALLYGEDRNRNGVLDPNENDGEENAPEDDANGELDRGIYPFITIWSRERNLDQDEKARVNVNSADADTLSKEVEGIDSNLAGGIVQARTLRGGEFQSIADLLDVPGMEIEKFREIVDRLTLTDDEEVEGLLNINTAPREVLLTLPGLAGDEATVDQILEVRRGSESDLNDIGWLLTVPPLAEEEGWVRFRVLAALITVRSQQFRATALGWVEGGVAFARLEAVLDRRTGASRVIWLRDATGLGLPMPLPEPTDDDDSSKLVDR